MATILLLNGPNLNMIGHREPQHYGNQSLTGLEEHLTSLTNHQLVSQQSNAEHQIIDWIQQSPQQNIDFIIINPGALTHTSIAIRDALLAVNIPFIEVHLSNLAKRESFRQHSYLADIAYGVIMGFGELSYELALMGAECYLAN